MNLIEKSNYYQKTAVDFLENSHFLEALTQFGRVEYEGAYAGKVMLDGDIDIRVVRNEPFAFADSVKLIEAVNELCPDDFRSYYLKADWEDPRFGNQFPQGKYVGFKFLLNDEKWKCDVWLLSEADHLKVRSSLNIANIELTEEQRNLILECKALRKETGIKKSGQEIYEAVLQNGLKKAEDLFTLK